MCFLGDRRQVLLLRVTIILVALFLSVRTSSSGPKRQLEQFKISDNSGDLVLIDNVAVARKRKQDNSIMTRILPMLAMPFITSATLLPMMLMSMKFMLLTSMFLGKMAVLFASLTLLKNWSKRREGLYSHNVHDPSDPSSWHHHDLKNQNYGYGRKLY